MLLPSPLLALLAGTALAAAAPRSPNIVLILVDDQDAKQDSIATMGRVQDLLVKQGTQFTHFYAPSTSRLGLMLGIRLTLWRQQSRSAVPPGRAC